MEELKGYEDIFDVDFSTVPRDSKYVGVIVEPRCHEMLSLVLKNFSYMMQGWSITIYHSDNNKEFIEKILGENHGVRLIRFCEDNITISEYNKLLMSKEFYQTVGGEKMLIFQCDSFIRRRNIEEFLQYDYIGAPWAPNSFCEGYLKLSVRVDKDVQVHDVIVGNGGLSLRTPSVMLEILDIVEIEDWKDKVNEDIFFAIGTYCLDHCKRCPPKIASTFSVETVYHHNPFGWHKAYNFWKGPQWEILKTIYPI